MDFTGISKLARSWLLPFGFVSTTTSAPSPPYVKQANCVNIDAKRPKFYELPLQQGDPKASAWGLWGRDDERGTLNLITSDVVARAREEIQIGVVTSLNLPINVPRRPMNPRRKPCEHRIIAKGHANDDELDINTQSSTHWDGLRHFPYSETKQFYNGVTQDDISGASASAKIGIQNIASSPVVTRGVLLDWYAYAERHSINVLAFKNQAIPLSQLKEVAREQGVAFRQGDVLLIRTGWLKKYYQLSDQQQDELGGRDDRASCGVEATEESIRWHWEQGFAAVASDTVAYEAWPSPKAWGVSMHEEIFNVVVIRFHRYMRHHPNCCKMVSKSDDALDEEIVTLWYDEPWHLERHDPPVRISIRIPKRVLIQESGEFDRRLNSSSEEAKSNIKQVNEYHTAGLHVILKALAAGDSHQSLRNDPAISNFAVAQDVYFITKAYDMPALHILVVEMLLPRALDIAWATQDPSNRLTAAEFKFTHYDLLKGRRSAPSEYPSDLWPLFLKALIHYQRVEPDFDLFSYIDDANMACYLAKQLSIKLVAEEDKTVNLTTQLKASGEPANERSNYLATQIKKVRSLTARVKALEEHTNELNSKLDARDAEVSKLTGELASEQIKAKDVDTKFAREQEKLVAHNDKLFAIGAGLQNLGKQLQA
ncbi:uncharacterized protein AB675_125 [Cyphellophora attinorum]|uniref:Uncharacterized protein n=1 Tax=Cyphellophora attinorum TaxID=1664694 RepID=A0A0N1H133_9EURO|nr:uncharacterized protein AB675_125 [Phialophora attinorum]KPI37684.1 hypothetical protein AB675_125 [Phialophora attinorum]